MEFLVVNGVVSARDVYTVRVVIDSIRFMVGVLCFILFDVY